MAEILKKIYAAPFAIGTFIWLFIAGLITYPYFFLTGFKAGQMRAFLYFQGKAVQLAITFASGFNKKIIKKNLPKKPAILVANHPSTYDTFLFQAFGIKDFVCIAKDWPFKIIFYGKFIEKAGYINTNNRTAEEIIEISRKRLDEGLHVAVFPEGTRQKEIGRFRSLAFELSLRSGAPVVPFVIKGLEEMLPRGSYIPKKTPVKYIQLDTVYPEDFKIEAGALRMAQYVKKLIKEEFNKY